MKASSPLKVACDYLYRNAPFLDDNRANVEKAVSLAVERGIKTAAALPFSGLFENLTSQGLKIKKIPLPPKIYARLRGKSIEISSIVDESPKKSANSMENMLIAHEFFHYLSIFSGELFPLKHPKQADSPSFIKPLRFKLLFVPINRIPVALEEISAWAFAGEINQNPQWWQFFEER